MIRTCDPLIRSQVLYPAELRVPFLVNSKWLIVNSKTWASLGRAGALSFVGKLGIPSKKSILGVELLSKPERLLDVVRVSILTREFML